MCDFSKGFILCKCTDPKVIVHNKKSRRNKIDPTKEYTWILHKYVGLSEEMEIGRYTLPVNDLKNGLTAAFVSTELNNRNCFDFDYTPTEGDNLIVGNEHSKDRMEFLFKNGNWIEDHYSPFDHVCEKIDNGKISASVE